MTSWVITWSAAILAIFALTAGLGLLLVSVAGPERRVSRRFAAIGAPAPSDDGPQPQERRSRLALADLRLAWLEPKLRAANAPFTVNQVAVAELTAAALLPVALRLMGVPVLIAIALSAALALSAPIAVLEWLIRRRRRRFVAQLPQAIDLVARGLQAGHPATTAIEAAARQMPDPIGPEFGVVIAEMGAGLDRDEALRNLAARYPCPELRMFAASLEITRETGGNVAEVLLGLSERLREHAQLRRKVAALSAEGRLSFWVICALPVIAGGVLMLIRPDYYGRVSGDPLFWRMMMLPPALIGIGAAIIWRMINFRV